MKKILLLLLIPGYCNAQLSENATKKDIIVTVDANKDAYKELNKSTNYEKVLKDIHQLYFTDKVNVNVKSDDTDRTLTAKSVSLIQDENIDIFKNETTLDDDAAIVLVRYAFQKQDATKKNKKLLNTFVIAEKDGKPTSYIWNKRRILIIYIDETIYADSILVKNQPSFFLKSFQAVVKSGLSLADGATNIATRLVFIDKKNIHPPSILSYQVPINDDKNTMDVDNGAKKKESITVHERNHFAFTIGVSGSLLNAHNFSINNDTISVTPDSSLKKTLKNSLILALEWYPYGRDIDNYSPIWQHLGDLRQRFGLTAGLSLTNDPLQSFYLGVVISVSKSFGIVVGSNFVNDYKNGQTLGLSSFASIDAAKDYLHRSYKGNLYFGITLSPSQAFKELTGK